MMTKLSVPGKLFLAGEYAITAPGQTAVIAATAMGLTLTVQDATTSSVTSNSIATPWQFNMSDPITIGQDHWRYVQAAIKILQDYTQAEATLPALSDVCITITSDLNGPYGKLGLGSSAAVVVGIIAALDAHFAWHIPRLTRFKLAGLAHYFVQKNGSLGDIAAITYGGVIAYQSPDLDQVMGSARQWPTPEEIARDWPALKITPLAWPAHWRLLLGATHESADTKSALHQLELNATFLAGSQQAVTQVIQALMTNDYAQLTQALQANQNVLQTHLPAGYVTPKLAHLLGTLNQIAGKISGAGYGDNGFAIVTDDATALIQSWQAAGIDPLLMTIFPENEVHYD